MIYGYDLLAQLIEACIAGNLESVHRILDQGALVDDLDDSQTHTALSAAVFRRRTEICSLLIDRGANVNLPDGNGSTPLSLAAQFGYREICKLLLENGAAVDRSDANGRTPLTIAAWCGHVATCTVLLDHGADVNLPQTDGWSPLMLSTYSQDTDVDEDNRIATCTLMLDRGAKIDQTNDVGWTVLIDAAFKGDVEICKLLLSRCADASIVDKKGKSALTIAIEQGHEQIAGMLRVNASQH
jgi:uncharacterized protein